MECSWNLLTIVKTEVVILTDYLNNSPIELSDLSVVFYNGLLLGFLRDHSECFWIHKGM